MDYRMGQAIAEKQAAERQYVGNGSILGADMPAYEAPLQRILRRIETAAQASHGIGHKLREHADTIHGGMPETSGEPATRPCRSGLIGAIEDALDELERAQSFLAEQAGRNSSLA